MPTPINHAKVACDAHRTLSTFTETLFELTDGVVKHYRSDLGQDIALVVRAIDAGYVPEYVLSVRDTGTWLIALPLRECGHELLRHEAGSPLPRVFHRLSYDPTRDRWDAESIEPTRAAIDGLPREGQRKY